MTVESAQLPFGDLRDYVERTFRHVAESKGLEFRSSSSRDLPQGSRPTPSACSRC